ncbi:MAG TPA: cob(I)yrinic acid a,c-diamide adenosyltransferase [Candidatus Nanoarchaeia archaeon]
MKKVRIYTRKGDRGKTSLIFGTRVSKDHPRVNAYGSVDELNASLGVAISFIRDKRIVKILQSIQNELFNIGVELASQKKLRKNTSGYYKLKQSKIEELENIIDQYDQNLLPLQTFILPSGTNTSSYLHLTRTVSRRTEREVAALAKREEVNPNILAYLNRLSDLLFVLARTLNKKAGGEEVTWKKE